MPGRVPPMLGRGPAPALGAPVAGPTFSPPTARPMSAFAGGPPAGPPPAQLTSILRNGSAPSDGRFSPPPAARPTEPRAAQEARPESRMRTGLRPESAVRASPRPDSALRFSNPRPESRMSGGASPEPASSPRLGALRKPFASKESAANQQAGEAPAGGKQLKHRRSILDKFRRESRTHQNEAPQASEFVPQRPAPPRPATPATAEGQSARVDAKHSWFNGILRLRSTQVVMSVENLTVTMETCQQLLRRLGATLTPLARAQLEQPLGQQGPISYVMERLYDHREGLVHTCKPMRFRVEYTILPVQSRPRGSAQAHSTPAMQRAPEWGRPTSRLDEAAQRAGLAKAPTGTEMSFATSVTFTHEKGSLTTFKLFMARLRRDWPLDARALGVE